MSEHSQGARDLECMMALPVADIHVLHTAISRNNSHRTVRVHTTTRHHVITEGQYSDERTYIASSYPPTGLEAKTVISTPENFTGTRKENLKW